MIVREKGPVLLVDDDKDLLQLIAMRLTAAGYAVTAVASGEAALSALAVSRPQVVVTDLRMQGMDGMALFDAIELMGRNPEARAGMDDYLNNGFFGLVG